MSDPAESSANLDFGSANDFSGSQISTGDIAGRDIIKHYSAAAWVRTLPALSQPVSDFIGRDDERQALGAVLLAGEAAVIRGMGGRGKTQLALRLAADTRTAFPDGQLLVELRGGSDQPRSTEDALRTVLWSLRGPVERLPDDLPSLVALYRTTLGGQRLLVLLDDAPTSAAARHFVPPAPCALLVTSRERITLDGQTRVLDLAVLPEAQSRALLLQLAPRLADDQHTADLLRRCANLPLALRVVGDTLRERPDLDTTRYLARLTDETRRLGALTHDDRDVYAILGASDTLLAERDAALAEHWRMLHVCPAPFDRAVIAALWGEPDDDALDDALGDLLRRSLLDYDSTTGRYSLHDLLRDVARQRCPAPAAATHAHVRHARYFCDVVNAADMLYQQGGEDVLRGLALFDTNLPHISAGQAWAAGRAGAEQLAIYYALRSPYILNLRLHPHTQIVWMEGARRAAQAIGNKASEGAALGNLGAAYQNLGEVTRAIGYYEQDLAIARAIGDRRGEENALGNLGTAYFSLGEVAWAIGYFEQDLKIARLIGDRRGEGAALGNLGNAYHKLGDVARAIGYYEQDLEIAREVGDLHGEGQALGNLGVAYFSLGEVARAIGSYEQRLKIAQAIGDRLGESRACWNLGLALESQAEYARAVALMQHHVEYLRELGHPDVEKDAARVEQVRRTAQAKGE